MVLQMEQVNIFKKNAYADKVLMESAFKTKISQNRNIKKD